MGAFHLTALWQALHSKGEQTYMIELSTLQIFLDDYLFFQKEMDITVIDPHMANGLMVKGKEAVKKVGFGVSASLSLFTKAKEANCDALVVHHSFNLPHYNYYDSLYQNRIAYLLTYGISLFGYHFLLDAHPVVGNNAQILTTIGARPVRPFTFKGNPWGWVGEFGETVAWAKVTEALKPFLSERMIEYACGQKMVKRIVAISGMGTPYPNHMQALVNEHIDGYITGEAHEWVRELFCEASINFLAGGHYATEVFGVKAVMEKIKKEFSQLEVEFIDLPNQV